MHLCKVFFLSSTFIKNNVKIFSFLENVVEKFNRRIDDILVPNIYNKINKHISFKY